MKSEPQDEVLAAPQDVSDEELSRLRLEYLVAEEEFNAAAKTKDLAFKKMSVAANALNAGLTRQDLARQRKH